MTKLGVSKNGMAVVVNLETSHAATHFADIPKLRTAVEESLPLVSLLKEQEQIEIDTGEIVGHSDLVETGPEDEIVYALRPRRDRYSRFVKNKVASETSWIVMRFDKLDEETYELYTAFVGRLTPSFPGGNFLPELSEEFWKHHALVWGNQEVIEGTETTECPW